MLFISVEDFFQKARGATRLSRTDEEDFALKMKEGNTEARQAIVNSCKRQFKQRLVREECLCQTIRV